MLYFNSTLLKEHDHCRCLAAYSDAAWRAAFPPAAAEAPVAPRAVFAILLGRRIIKLTGTSHRHRNITAQTKRATPKEAHRREVVNRLLFTNLFWRIMPSMRATLPNKYPQNAVDERTKKQLHDSTEDAEIVPAPPKMKLMDVTTNSARNRTPPELPRSYRSEKK